MNLYSRTILSLVTIFSFGFGSLASSATASASTVQKTSTICSVVAKGSKDTAGSSDSRFSLGSSNTVSSTVEVAGGSNCKETVTMVSWQAPDSSKGRPYTQQTLFAHETETFGVGSHTISVSVPDCYYQVDLVKGSSDTGANGGSVYTASAMLGSLHGGNTACTTTPDPTPTPTPTPTTTPTSTTPSTPSAQTSSLPSTGSGATPFVLAGITAVAGTAFSYFRKVRKFSL